MDKLKTCPFCGERVTIYYSSATKGYFFMHRNGDGECVILTPSTIAGKYKSLAETYEAWNRRAKHE